MKKNIKIAIPIILIFNLWLTASVKNSIKIETIELEIGDGFYQNAYIVFNKDTGDAVIIDPGKVDPRIEEYIKVKNLEVHKILNTHGHWDHIGGNGYYSKLYKAEVIASKEDIQRYKDLRNRPGNFFGKIDKFAVPGINIKVFHTPGHTPGSVCYYLQGFLISGDTLFHESIGKTSGQKAESLMIKGIKEKLLTLPPQTIVLPGHGESTTIEHEKKLNPFLK